MFNVCSRSGQIMLAVLVGLVSCLSGCGGGDEALNPTKLAKVSGNATVNGEPIAKEGLSIMFESEDGSTNNVEIKQGGEFSGQAPIGEVKVTLFVIGGVDDHGDATSVTKTFGVDEGFLDGNRSHKVTIGESGTTGMKFDFGAGE
jgi:hypothetical protein